MLRTVQRLDSVGIPVRVLKGTASSHLDYPDPALRTYGDVDLLVPGDHYEQAVRLLVSDGAHRRYPEPRTGFDRRFGKGCSLRTPDGLEVDLHRTFTMGPYGESLALESCGRAARPSHRRDGVSGAVARGATRARGLPCGARRHPPAAGPVA